MFEKKTDAALSTRQSMERATCSKNALGKRPYRRRETVVMGNSVDISIVIRTLNEAQWMPQLLDAIADQDLSGMTAETIVVDSGSTDRTYELSEARGCRMVTIEKNRSSHLAAHSIMGALPQEESG
ncbi:glycosyltransferase [Novosphingobium colocasiae]